MHFEEIAASDSFYIKDKMKGFLTAAMISPLVSKHLSFCS